MRLNTGHGQIQRVGKGGLDWILAEKLQVAKGFLVSPGTDPPPRDEVMLEHGP